MTDAGMIEIAAGVVAAVRSTADALAAGGASRADEAAAAALPAWRVPEYLACRGLLRRLLADMVGADAAGAELRARPAGQPYLAGYPGVGISVSHTGGTVAAAVGVGHPVGVDVQAPTTLSAGLIARCCTPDVADVLAALPPARRDVEFAAIWAVQEACVKAAGTGMSGAPWRIPVGYGQATGAWGAYEWRALRGPGLPPAACAYAAEGADRAYGR
jgi:4'-phosphopantetheinyl transferase